MAFVSITAGKIGIEKKRYREKKVCVMVVYSITLKQEKRYRPMKRHYSVHEYRKWVSS